MKRKHLTAAALSIGVLTFAGLIVYAGETNKVSPEFRKQFLDSFKRTSLNTTPEDAMMLRILVESSRAKRGVEVGTASGFGAINMGIAFERTGGHLWTHDINPAAIKDTQENLKKVGLDKVVTCVEGDALQTLQKIEGPVDFVFIDALKKDYLKYFKILEPKLAPNAVVVADNVIVSARDMKDYLDFVQNSPDYDTVIIRCSLEKKDGMSISYKIK
jgi:predicted O-methyltransferase YrrM